MARSWKRPRAHIPLDVAFLDQDSIRDLGEQFGAAGPLTIIALVTEAGAAIPGKGGKDFDIVEGRYSGLARSAYVDERRSRAIVALAAEVGLVEILDQPDAQRFKLRLLKWSKWHPKDPGAAVRKANSRAKGDPPTDDAAF